MSSSRFWPLAQLLSPQVVGVAVPLLAIATALSMGVLTQAWVLVAIALTAVAALVLVASILPDQRAPP
jgi:hypothetical protein